MILVTIKNSHDMVLLSCINRDVIQAIKNKIDKVDKVLDKKISEVDLQSITDRKEIIEMYDTAKHNVLNLAGLGSNPPKRGCYRFGLPSCKWSLIISEIDV